MVFLMQLTKANCIFDVTKMKRTGIVQKTKKPSEENKYLRKQLEVVADVLVTQFTKLCVTLVHISEAALKKLSL